MNKKTAFAKELLRDKKSPFVLCAYCRHLRIIGIMTTKTCKYVTIDAETNNCVNWQWNKKCK